jgi:non-specific serine/threonine protein kinase
MLAAGVAESATQVQHDVLRTSLSGKHVLLVLDNFEHVIDAAPEVASLLRECPCLTILVTSRTLLRISGEQVFPVPPLEHADAASPAVALFSERASAILPSFRLNASTAPIVEDICRLLDGLPLAIELAAARVNTLSLSALRDRLIWQMTLLTGGHRDAPKRHRTMRDAIAWSYDFLSAGEQVVLRRLSVFAGGFHIDAVPTVVSDGSEEEVNLRPRNTEAEDRILDVVGSLIDKSLLQRADQENRLAMLSPIRAYALEQLVATGDEIATRNRHAAWCLEFAQGLPGGWNDAPVDPCWLRSADAEHDNIRAALAWMESQHDGPGLLRLAIQIRWIWEVRGLSSEAVNWFERGLEIASDAEPSLRLKAHAILGRTLRRRGRYDLARQHLQSALSLAHELDDEVAAARAVYALGSLETNLAHYDDARALLNDARERFELQGDMAGVCGACYFLGNVSIGANDFTTAAAHLEAALSLRLRDESTFNLSVLLNALALVRCELGEAEVARSLLARSWSAWNEGDGANPDILAECLAISALLAALQRCPERAVRLLGTAEALTQSLDMPLMVPPPGLYQHHMAMLRSALGPQLFCEAWLAGRSLPLDEAIAEARKLEYAPGEAGDHALSRREMEVLNLLAAGRRDREIAQLLFISVRTVQGHVAHILDKLEVPTRSAAVSLAVARGLIRST